MEQTINNLINQTEKEIERLVKVKSIRVVSHGKRRRINNQLIECRAKLSALQQAKDIFIKMLDERIKEYSDEQEILERNNEGFSLSYHHKMEELKEIKQKLIGDVSENG